MESTLGSLALRESFERRFRMNHTCFRLIFKRMEHWSLKKIDMHKNVHTVKNLAFVVCRAKGRLRLAVLLGSGLVRSFGVLVFRMVAERLREHPSVAVLWLQSGASLSRDEYPSTEYCR